MPPTAPKPRHSARIDRKPINEELGLSFPLEELKWSEAPRNHEVLEHLFFILSSKDKGRMTMDDAVDVVVAAVQSRWRGSNIAQLDERTLVKNVKALHSQYEYVVLFSM